MFRTRFSPADGLLLGGLLTLSLLLLLLPAIWQRSGTDLVISHAGGSAQYSLSEDRQIPLSVGAHSLTVEISAGRARVLQSSCPDGICMAGGWIEHSGETVICAPAGVRLQITSSKGGNGNVDFVAG